LYRWLILQFSILFYGKNLYAWFRIAQLVESIKAVFSNSLEFFTY
jgi:hypothetical protein